MNVLPRKYIHKNYNNNNIMCEIYRKDKSKGKMRKKEREPIWILELDGKW